MSEYLLEWPFRETLQKSFICGLITSVWTSPRWIIRCFVHRILNWRMDSLILVWFQIFTTVSSTTYSTTGKYNSLWRSPAWMPHRFAIENSLMLLRLKCGRITLLTIFSKWLTWLRTNQGLCGYQAWSDWLLGSFNQGRHRRQRERRHSI